MTRTSVRVAAAFAAASMLAGPLPADPPPLVPGPTIAIPNAKGKFDFLNVDPERRRLLAGHEEDGTADIFDLKTNRVLARLKLGKAVEVVADSQRAVYYVSLQEEKRVAFVDAETLEETGAVEVPGETDAIFFCAKNRRLYVAHDNGEHLWVIDVDQRKLAATIDIPPSPECMAFDAARDRLYLNIKGTNEVVAIDTRTNRLAATWRTLPATGPHGLAFDEKNNRLLIAGNNGNLTILDATDGKLVTEFDLVWGIDQTAYDPQLRRLYCAGIGALAVVQITDAGGEVIGEVKTAPTARNVTVDPATHAVWTTFSDGTNSYAKSWKPQ